MYILNYINYDHSNLTKPGPVQYVGGPFPFSPPPPAPGAGAEPQKDEAPNAL